MYANRQTQEKKIGNRNRPTDDPDISRQTWVLKQK